MGLKMSYKALIWALGQEDLKSRERLVLIYLADHCNEEKGYAWPSIKRLAKRTGMGQSTVKRAVATLELMGLVRVSRQSKVVDGARFSNRYYLACFPAHPFQYNYPVTGDFNQKGEWDPEIDYRQR